LMDILKQNHKGKNERNEYFLLHLGNARVEVLSIDDKLKQLVLLVQEEETTFTVEEFYHDSAHIQHKRIITKTTPAIVRRFLIGMDELHLFIAPLKKSANTVKEAHDSLKPKNLRSKIKGTFKRQGEWFLVPCSNQELDEIERKLDSRNGQTDAQSLVRISYSKGLGYVERSRGREHKADEVVVLDGTREFARGNLLHPDHATVKLRDWHRVFKNAEDTSSNIKGMS